MQILKVVKHPMITELFNIIFKVDFELFEAWIYEDDDITYVRSCELVKRNESIEIDIPEYFGRSLSSDVYTLLYNSLKDAVEAESIYKAMYEIILKEERKAQAARKIN
jgi:hypothetical protein